MSSPIATIDTDVLVWLLDTSSKPEAKNARAYVELTIERLKEQRARWVVPTPVIAELSRDGRGSERIREVVKLILRRVRVEVLDMAAADVAGEICRMALKKRPPGKERAAVKYDALIAATAHKIGARWLLTANGDDMRRYLKAIASPVEVVVATQPPSTGQTIMLSVLKPGTQPEQAAPVDRPPVEPPATEPMDTAAGGKEVTARTRMTAVGEEIDLAERGGDE